MEKLKEQIKKLYFEEELSQRQVAKELNIGTTTVANYLKEMGGSRTQVEGSLLRTTPEYSAKIRETQLGELNNSVKLTEEDVLAIRKEYEEALQKGKQKTEMQYHLADKYGVKRPTVSDIVLGRTWKHI